jgi:hypothetical protein
MPVGSRCRSYLDYLLTSIPREAQSEMIRAQFYERVAEAVRMISLPQDRKATISYERTECTCKVTENIDAHYVAIVRKIEVPGPYQALETRRQER